LAVRKDEPQPQEAMAFTSVTINDLPALGLLFISRFVPEYRFLLIVDHSLTHTLYYSLHLRFGQ
ncbi:hypothetical protein MZE24_19340, partial [Bacillus amyloliquefaciens]|uniref:hypothetical protein n=1 Tax=Bacillus amyloliquefaciens TaxID=1390 RepID=UPI00211A2C71